MTFDYRTDPIFSAALAYWNLRRGDRLMPSRRDIDPADIPKLLPHVQLIDVVEGGERFRFRVAGTHLVAAWGTDYTGKYADEIFSADRRRFAESLYRSVCESRKPQFMRSPYIARRDVDLISSRLQMPLSDDGETVTMLFGVYTFEFGGHSLDGVWAEAEPDWPSSFAKLRNRRIKNPSRGGDWGEDAELRGGSARRLMPII